MLENSVQVAPSILSADLGHLADELASIEGAGYVHFDAMDGHFVPNLTFGPGVLAAVKEATQTPVDAHLMISNPDQMVPEYLAAGADVVTFHYEATAHANRLANLIREKGAKAGVAINPGTPVSSLDALIEDVDLVLVMTVAVAGLAMFVGVVVVVAAARGLAVLCERAGDKGLDAGVAAALGARIDRDAGLGERVDGASADTAADEQIHLVLCQQYCQSRMSALPGT